jgi:hypothetical protein
MSFQHLSRVYDFASPAQSDVNSNYRVLTPGEK